MAHNPSLRHRYDCFAGNLGDITEQQLFEIFSRVGPVKKYDDAAVALSAIRNLDGFEVHGRKIRVSYTNTSGLKDIASALGHTGHDMSQLDETVDWTSQTPTVKDIINGLSVHECHDLLVAMKGYIDEDRGIRAKQLFTEFPQLTTAYSEIQMKLGMGLGITQADLNQSSLNFMPESMPQPQYHFQQYQQYPPGRHQQFAPPLGPSVDPYTDPYMMGGGPPQHIDHYAQGMHVQMGLPSIPPGADPELMYQVMNASAQDLAMMPENDRRHLLAMRENFLRGGGGPMY